MNWRRFKGLTLTVVVFAVACFVLWSGIEVGKGGRDEPSFHVDEAHKISETYYFHLWFENGGLEHPDWTGDFYARTNPPVAKYVFGLALAAAGQGVRDRNLQSDFERLWKNPAELRRLVPDDQLCVTRRVSAVYGALICAALFFIAYRAIGPGAGVIAVVLLLASPEFVHTARRGLTDSILLFHLALVGPVTILATDVLTPWWARESRGTGWSRRAALVFQTILLPGVTIALAAGSKLNGALTAPIYTLGVLLAAIRARESPLSLVRRVQGGIVLSGLTALVALAVFVGMNPYFYAGPLGRALDTLRVFGDWMICQQINPGEGLFSVRDRTAAVIQALFAGSFTTLPRWLGVGSPYFAACATLAGLTCLVLRCRIDNLTGDSRRRLEGARDSAMDVAIVWSLTCVVAVTVWLPVAWDRYFLPPYLAACLLAGIGLSVVPRVAWRMVGMLRAQVPVRELWRFGIVALVVPAGSVLLVSAAWGRGLETAPETWDEPGGISWWSDSPRLHRHLGLKALQMGLLLQAREQFERALEMVGSDPGDRSSAAVQRCCLLNEVAIMRYRVGEQKGAVEALEEHIALLERFRDRMASNDPYVRASSTLLIEERSQDLVRLRQSR